MGIGADFLDEKVDQEERDIKELLSQNTNKKMEKTATITNIQGDGSYESQYGTLYKFEYQFNDGEMLTASHKTQACPFKIGDSVVYEIKGQNDYGKYGKVSKPQQNNFVRNKTSKEQNRSASFALAYAKDYAGFYISTGTDYTPDEIIATATKFNQWLKDNE